MLLFKGSINQKGLFDFLLNRRSSNVPPELGRNKAVKAILWPWLQPFLFEAVGDSAGIPLLASLAPESSAYGTCEIFRARF